MNAIDLAQETTNYLSILSTLESREQTYLHAKGKRIPVFSKSVRLRYETITLELHEIEDDGSQRINTTCTFEINRANVVLASVYCEDKEWEKDVKDYLTHHAPIIFPDKKSAKNVLTTETMICLKIADDIASQGYACSSGDDYRPGNFSEIMVNDSAIILKQINHWNSRSIDHKNDYHLRDLEFRIPLTAAKGKLSFDEEYIGSMIVRFSDRSSENNKVCGNNIRQAIEEERLKLQK